MEKPKLQLSGKDGNAMFIMGRARSTMKKHLRDQGKTPNEIKTYLDEMSRKMLSGNYDNVIKVCNDYFDVY